jgi:nicotinamidase-related amidase
VTAQVREVLFDQSPKQPGLRFGPLGENWVHLCIDMQRMFAEETDWHTPWMSKVLPNVVSVVELAPNRTVFTRFIPPASPDDCGGSWRRYYQRWSGMTTQQMNPVLLELIPELVNFVPPAAVYDKMVMSPWFGNLHSKLRAANVNAMIVTGAETEVCVLATMLGGMDLGYRMILVLDGICSSADDTHDAMVGIYQSRYGMQVETTTTAELTAARHDGYLL